MFSIFDLIALLLTLSAVLSWVNYRLTRLPRTIGLLVMGLIMSLILILADLLLPHEHIHEHLSELVRQIDFSAVVMDGMLAFLLFAGALNVDLTALRSRTGPVATLACVGTVMSAVIVGFLFWGVARLLGDALPLSWALVFGALISPTDPIAVLAMLKSVKIPETLRAQMKGEALFNDGVAIVAFTFLLTIAVQGADAQSPVDAIFALTKDVGGGVVLGLLSGHLSYRAIRLIDDFAIELLITLALVAGVYALARHLYISGPLAVVTAGLLLGELAPRDAMSERSGKYVFAMWTIIDEVLNSVLFLMIGLQVMIIGFNRPALLLALAAIPIVLAARCIAVSTPLVLFRWSGRLSARNVPFLTWAAVRGGISVALALSLPNVAEKPLILTATYVVVLFTIIVQGSTVERVARRTLKQAPNEAS